MSRRKRKPNNGRGNLNSGPAVITPPPVEIVPPPDITNSVSATSSPPPPRSECKPYSGAGIDRDLLKELFKTLQDQHDKNCERHDKELLAVAGSALALSITFVDKFAPQPIPWSYSLLIAAWGGFCLCIGSVISSLLVAQWACGANINAVRTVLFGWPGAYNEDSHWSNKTRILNAASTVFFLGGLASLLLFVWVNLSNTLKVKESLQMQSVQKQVRFDALEGAPPSRLPPKAATNSLATATTSTPQKPDEAPKPDKKEDR